MPFAVLKSVREVSSEEKVHCAANLLQNEPAKKWRTGEDDVKSAYVIIEMESEYSIKGIDIGNESSAFIEVLVGGPGCARENFKEILITCSFMTPIESRNNTNPNRVRCFNRDALVEAIADQKWKLLKIVCTQPFNKHVRYGLSFIKIHVDAQPETKKSLVPNGFAGPSLTSRTCGGFTLREDSPESESESTTALFNRWKGSKNRDASVTSSVPRTPCSAMLKKPQESFSQKKLANATPPSVERIASKENRGVPDRNRDSLLFTDDDDESTMQSKQRKRLEKLEKVISADQERVAKETDKGKRPKKHESVENEVNNVDKQKKEVDKPELSTKNIPANVSKPSTPSTSGQRRPSSSPCTSAKAKKPKLDSTVQYRPFNQLLSGVVLVISGIQNPGRADLRSKALALGAKYKADWDSSCTHLICAFKNTPKYNQVKGVGKIIKRTWIEDCHNRQTRLPWRRYALDSAEQDKPESEDEILDELLKPEDSEPSVSRRNSEDDDIVEIYDNIAVNHSHVISSGSDTEDEIQRVLASTLPQKKAAIDIYELSTEEEDYIPKKTKVVPNIYEVSTEEEDYISKKTKVIPKDLTFFKDLKFFVSDQLSAVEKIKVERHIETFHGDLTNSVKDANYVIATKRMADCGKLKGEVVLPLWILECNGAERFIPTKRYLVT